MSYYYKKIISTDKGVLRDVEEDRQSRLWADRLIFYLLLLAITFVPILVGGYVKEVTSPHITNTELLTSGLKGDIFTHYKAIALVIITVTAVGLLLAKILFMGGEIRKTKTNIFLTIFAIAIVLSTIFSPSISIALWGQYDHSDGAISYLCYIALFFVAINIEYPKRAINYVMYALYPFITINALLSTLYFYGFDLMSVKIVEKGLSLFLPEGTSLTEGSILLGTLNQWNFMSGMFAVMTIMYLAWAIVDTNRVRSFINAGVAVVSFAIMLMSISTSGFLTVVVLVPFLIVLIVKSGNPRKALVATLAFIIVSAPVFHILAEKNPRVWSESIGFVIKKNPYVKEQRTASATSNLKFSFENRVYAAENHFELPELPERGVAAGSGRAYIWQKTLNLTMDRPLFGYGLDTLMYHFPHYNIDARAGMWSENTIVDKPHSMYMGIFYGTGIVGIIGFAGIAILTVLAALKVVFNRKYTSIAILATGWLAFLVQALFNDSLPGTAGPMWALAGMMIGMLLINNEVEEKTNGRDD